MQGNSLAYLTVYLLVVDNFKKLKVNTLFAYFDDFNFNLIADMKDFFYDDDNAQKKMVSCQWDVVDRNNTLYGKVEFRLREPFTAEEKELVRSWCIGQAADGLGEGLEQRPIETEDGDLYVSMWNSGDDYFMYDEDEMNDYLAQQQGGVMTQ